MLRTKRQLGLFLILTASLWIQPLQAEFLRIEIDVPDMDCASCVRAVSRGVDRIEGIESARVSADAGRAELKLKPGNTVTLREIVGLVRRTGFNPAKISVVVKGEVDLQEEHSILRVSGTEESYRLDLEGLEAKAKDSIRSSPGSEIVLEGELSVEASPEAALRVTDFRPAAAASVAN